MWFSPSIAWYRFSKPVKGKKNVSNASNTRKSVSLDFQTRRGELKKQNASEFFNLFRGVEIPDETLFQVFDTASQTDH